MGFVKSAEEIASLYSETAEFYDAEMLTVFWETRPEIVEHLLPPPLKPAGRPLAMAFVANYPRTSFGPSYLESALFLRAEFEGVEGSYCLAMPVSNDMALALGREVFGYPKKIGEIAFQREGEDFFGYTERHGVRFVEIKAKLNGRFNTEDAAQVAMETFGLGDSFIAVSYNFKHFPSPDRLGFDYNPRLVREEVEFRPKNMEIGQAEIILQPSQFDPWSEVEVVRLLGAVYSKGNNTMRPGQVVAETSMEIFAPYAFIKWDM